MKVLFNTLGDYETFNEQLKKMNVFLIITLVGILRMYMKEKSIMST